MPEAVRNPTQRAIAALWQRNQPQVLGRLALLARAAAAAVDGTLTAALHEEALGIAHKFAGSLGMFGFQEGTRIAREMEVLLEPAELDGTALAALIVSLRHCLFP